MPELTVPLLYFACFGRPLVGLSPIFVLTAKLLRYQVACY